MRASKTPRKKPITVDGQQHWHCVGCNQFHPSDQFGRIRGRPKARCYQCTRSTNRKRYSPYDNGPREDAEYLELIAEVHERAESQRQGFRDLMKEILRAYLTPLPMTPVPPPAPSSSAREESP